MTHPKWHILRDGDMLTLTRRIPARFDLCVQTTLLNASRLRIAQQIRQDMWRALQRLRGFSPAVQVVRRPEGLVIIAGGQVDGRFPRQQVEAQLAEVLNDPANRARWMRWAT